MTAIGAWAVVTDRISYQVTYGVSMEPVYQQGDLIIVLKQDSYEIGQIAAYHGNQSGLVVLHRIIGGDERGYVLKGDNNPSLDAQHPAGDDLIGKAVLHVPHGGKWLAPLFSPTGLGMLAFLVVGAGSVAARTRREIPRGRRKKRVGAMSRQGRIGLAVLRWLMALPPLLRVLAVAVAAVGLVGLVLGLLGWLGPVKQQRADSGQSMTFSYSAKVPRTPAYDDTTITSPEPIFRKLVPWLDLHLAYRGEPGRIAVTAALSNQTGWHTRIPLAAARSFTTDSYQSTVRLDLDAIEQRAKDAAEAIGAAEQPVTVRVEALVNTGAGEPFEPAVRFDIAPLLVTLPDGVGSLKVDGAAGSEQREPRPISVLGWELTTAGEARSWGVRLLLLALVGGGLIAAAARGLRRPDGSAEIHRRHGKLLVEVEPMASPPGKPVVNVDHFQALVRLAERYGQMVLTWKVAGTETFVVRDEGVTYRFRIGTEDPPPVDEDGNPLRRMSPDRRTSPERRAGGRKSAAKTEDPAAPAADEPSPSGSASEGDLKVLVPTKAAPAKAPAAAKPRPTKAQAAAKPGPAKAQAGAGAAKPSPAKAQAGTAKPSPAAVPDAVETAPGTPAAHLTRAAADPATEGVPPAEATASAKTPGEPGTSLSPAEPKKPASSGSSPTQDADDA